MGFYYNLNLLNQNLSLIKSKFITLNKDKFYCIVVLLN